MQTRWITSRSLAAATLTAGMALAGALMAGPPSRVTAKLIVKETSLGKIPPGMAVKELVVSPDRRHVALVVKRGERERVVVDGVEGKGYKYIKQRKYAPRAARASPGSA